jgi:hypothetical protein
MSATRPRLAIGRFVLINLLSQGKYSRPMPQTIRTTYKANWERQDIVGGVKSLMYANNEPAVVVPSELHLDKSDTFESVRPEMDGLIALTRRANRGTPPPLLAIWGSNQVLVVLEEVEFEEGPFNRAGDPYRAVATTSFTQLQQETSVSVVIVDDFEAASFDPIGNF